MPSTLGDKGRELLPSAGTKCVLVELRDLVGGEIARLSKGIQDQRFDERAGYVPVLAGPSHELPVKVWVKLYGQALELDLVVLRQLKGSLGGEIRNVNVRTLHSFAGC